jgi:hypothetical protein
MSFSYLLDTEALKHPCQRVEALIFDIIEVILIVSKLLQPIFILVVVQFTVYVRIFLENVNLSLFHVPDQKS